MLKMQICFNHPQCLNEPQTDKTIEQRNLRRICTWTSKRTFYQNRSIEGGEYCRGESVSRRCLAVKPNQDSRYCSCLTEKIQTDQCNFLGGYTASIYIELRICSKFDFLLHFLCFTFCCNNDYCFFRFMVPYIVVIT